LLIAVIPTLLFFDVLLLLVDRCFNAHDRRQLALTLHLGSIVEPQTVGMPPPKVYGQWGNVARDAPASPLDPEQSHSKMIVHQAGENST
jgi:hypothetical protein